MSSTRIRSKVPIGTTERLFGTLHRRLLDRGYETPPWDKLNVDHLSAESIEEARHSWAARTVGEYRSMIVFGELIARFPEMGLPLEVTTAASRLLSDEARHTELCLRVADALGGHGGITLDKRELRLVDDRLPAHLFVARWTTSMFCVGESASVSVLRVFLAHAKNPCIESVLRILLRDEILHDRFGWALARLVLPRLTDDEQEWLAADLAKTFAYYERSHGVLSDFTDDDPGELGMGTDRERSEAFLKRVHSLILPSLARLGVPAYEAWELRAEARGF